MKLIYGISQRCVWMATFIVTRLFTKFYVNGRDNLKSIQTPLLIVANHRSYFDSVIIGTLFPFFSKYIPMGFMATDKLYQKFFYKIFFALTGTFPAHRGEGLDISLRYPRSVLRENGVFLIFPFGKLVFDNQYPKPGRGAAKLVQDFPNLVILPIYLNTTPNLGVKDILFGKKDMGVVIGKSFLISNAQSMDIDQISKIISDKILSLGS